MVMQQPSPQQRGERVMKEIMSETLVMGVLPAVLLSVVGVAALQRRARHGQAGGLERLTLAGLAHWGGFSISSSIGYAFYLAINGDRFEKKILKEAPDSEAARTLKNIKSGKTDDG